MGEKPALGREQAVSMHKIEKVAMLTFPCMLPSHFVLQMPMRSGHSKPRGCWERSCCTDGDPVSRLYWPSALPVPGRGGECPEPWLS